MKLSYKWLSEYVDLTGITPEVLAEKMTFAGLEVEGLEQVATGENLVIGEILSCVAHPDSDHLHITQVRIGQNENDIVQIVCGAANCRQGLKVIVALEGAILPGGTITAKPVRGAESHGMLCSLVELGVSKHILREEQVNGIEELPSDAPVGENDVLKYLELDDTILDVSLTPNRADCSSMWNMAKEVGAILRREVTWPDFKGKSNVGKTTDFKVVSNSEKCTIYAGKVINSIQIKPSPKWISDHLKSVGMNSVNNVVDISNFVMLETGQPLHFYDLKKLPNREIEIYDNQETKLTTLDGQEVDIKKGDIVLLTDGKVAGIAGIMGGKDSMIDETTTSILIEAAHFDPASIRRSANRLNMVTEAAQRFTKGLEPLSVTKAMDRAVQLLIEYASADEIEETVVVATESYQPKVITETLEHCNGLLGTNFTMEQVLEVLTALHFEPSLEGEKIHCHIPSYRTDIEGAADIDEEIIRLLGFDSLNSTLPYMQASVGKRTPMQKMRYMTRQLLSSMNLHEIITYTLVNEDFIVNAYQPVGEAIALAMPMSEARKYVRNSLLNSVLECVQYNKAHQNTNLGYYEISKVYGKNIDEERLAIVLDGNLRTDYFRKKETSGDFFTMKAMILEWLKKFGFDIGRVKFIVNEKDTIHFHPYRSAEILLDESSIGIFGEIHPSYAKKFDLKRVTYAELSMDTVISGKASAIRFIPLDKYPSVSRDIALVVKKEVPIEQINQVISNVGSSLVRSCVLFDIYEGEHVQEGYKSVAMRIVYQSGDHTLKEEEISAVHQEILEELDRSLEAKLRS